MKHLPLIMLVALNCATTFCSPFKKLMQGAQNGNSAQVRAALEDGASIDRIDQRTKKSVFCVFATHYQNTPPHNEILDMLVRQKETFTQEELTRVLITGQYPLVAAVLEKHSMSTHTPLEKRFYIQHTKHIKNRALLILGLKNRILQEKDITRALVRKFSPQKKIRYSRILPTILDAARLTQKEAVSQVQETLEPVTASDFARCTICQEDLKLSGKEVTVLPCYDVFHHACIQPWFAQNTDHSCPTCRRKPGAIKHNIAINRLP